MVSNKSNPKYIISKGKVTFTVPYIDADTFRYVYMILKSMGNVTNNVRKSNSGNYTLSFTVKTSKENDIRLSKNFVRKLYKVDKPLDKKNNITKENLIQWSKYMKYGKNVNTINDLIQANRKIKENTKLYRLWNKYGDQVLKEVKGMKILLNPTNLKMAVGTQKNDKNIFYLQLSQQMAAYLKYEKLVYKMKSEFDLISAFKDYREKYKDEFHINVSSIAEQWKNTYNRSKKKDNEIEEMYYTIGSIIFPNAGYILSPYNRNSVWKYTLKNVIKIESEEYTDPWIKTLSSRDGFVSILNDINENIKITLSSLVNSFLSEKISNENKEKAMNGAKELYDICKKCKLEQHPQFRICAGFDAINKEGKLMDYFRFCIHTQDKQKLQQQYFITKKQCKYFYLSRDVLPKSQKFYLSESTKRVNSKEGNHQKNDKSDLVVAWPNYNETTKYYEY